MRFLVEITVDFPGELRDPGDPRRAALVAAELERGLELRRTGTIEAIWRVPSDDAGIVRNAGIWNADSEDALRGVLASLPLGKWISAKVTPLTEHPIERALRSREGEAA